MATSSFYKLSAEQREYLRHQPETGMGYQLIKQGADLFVVSNGERLMKLGAGPSPIITHPELIVLDEPHERFDTSEVLRNAKFAEIPKGFSPSNLSTETLQADVLPSQPIFPYLTQSGDEFVRLASSPHDWRIDDNGGLAGKSYATTPSDLKVVPSGIAAVGRYALPYNTPACYLYRIIPPVGTEIYFGTVWPSTYEAPLINYCGGGVEVYFPNPLPPGSARLLKTIPML